MNRIFQRILIATALCFAAAGAAAAATSVDINTADAATLADSLNGVGMVKAEAIVAYRDEHGPFDSADQLIEVKGIGLRTVENNREVIEVTKRDGGKPARSASED